LKRTAQELEANGILKVRVPDCRDERWAQHLTEEFRAGARHAGSYETSLILAAREDLVRREAMEGLKPVWVDLPKAIAAGARTFAEAGSELAYFGDPTQASVEEGETCYQGLAHMLVTTCRELLAELNEQTDAGNGDDARSHN
jgi:creatinine amidohydrolase